MNYEDYEYGGIIPPKGKIGDIGLYEVITNNNPYGYSLDDKVLFTDEERKFVFLSNKST